MLILSLRLKSDLILFQLYFLLILFLFLFNYLIPEFHQQKDKTIAAQSQPTWSWHCPLQNIVQTLISSGTYIL